MKLFAINNTEQQQEQKCLSSIKFKWKKLTRTVSTTIVKNSVQSIRSKSI